MVVIYCSQMTQSKISKEKRGLEWSLEEGGNWMQVSKDPLSVDPKAVLNFPSRELWQHLWNVAHQGSPLETEGPGFLLEAGHVGTFWLACAKALAQKESRCSQINYIACTNSLGRVRHSYWSWEWLSRDPSSQTPDKGQSWKQAFQRMAVSGLEDRDLCFVPWCIPWNSVWHIVSAQ